MVRKVLAAILTLVVFSGSALAAAKLPIGYVTEPFPGLSWESDFVDTVSACRGKDLLIITPEENNVQMVVMDNVFISGCNATTAALILEADRLSAVYYEITDGGENTFGALKACYSTLYGKQYEGNEVYEPSGVIDFTANGAMKQEIEA